MQVALSALAGTFAAGLTFKGLQGRASAQLPADPNKTREEDPESKNVSDEPPPKPKKPGPPPVPKRTFGSKAPLVQVPKRTKNAPVRPRKPPPMAGMKPARDKKS